ncbi:DUF4253 domain-containing protein [Paenibacillus mucilaginosus]|uniref:DUF4253 domain-containing protein n=1 Tax=Paenibacillus mucilaginosus (strain KNP414) TaxID=1036673 RepID=F8F794_PAEMK|nr:DUF4253 domain-containing protein [Paenibacillus mucilaginosus]AEI45119.1 hypothetical protein KNP414_06598 [Paenibacillus mucilaginosus KNP414]MCG7212986.1 DUF4253 domain-containing protein [Paenibacillus mucilaginosus]WDM26603.1 DUF4253 domain-containing protein [Paenibacillus mucilaginosus]
MTLWIAIILAVSVGGWLIRYLSDNHGWSGTDPLEREAPGGGPLPHRGAPEYWAGLGEIRTLEDAGRVLRELSGQEPKPYASIEFGRSRNEACLSVMTASAAARSWVYGLQECLGPGLVAYAGAESSLGRSSVWHREVVVGPGRDQFAIVEHAGTDACNYGMAMEDILAKLKSFDERYGIRIREASWDSVGFDLVRRPDDIPAFCAELYEFCPDVVDQGVDSMEALEELVREDGYIVL